MAKSRVQKRTSIVEADRYEEVSSWLLDLGEDVRSRSLGLYTAFTRTVGQRVATFACIELHPLTQHMLIYTMLDPDSISLVPGFTRDVRSVPHLGTGHLEITILRDADLEEAKRLLSLSYAIS